MNTTVRRYLLLVPVFVLASSLWMSGCDPVEPGVFSLPSEPVRLTFTFSGSGIEAGQTVVRTDDLDLLRIVLRHNFTAGDVVSARTDGPIQIEVFLPPGETLDAFAAAELRAEGLLLASGSGFPAQATANLTRRATNIASVVVAGETIAELTLEVARALQNHPYSIDVRFNVVIDVEG